MWPAPDLYMNSLTWQRLIFSLLIILKNSSWNNLDLLSCVFLPALYLPLVIFQSTSWGCHHSRNFPCSPGIPEFYPKYFIMKVLVSLQLKLLNSQSLFWTNQVFESLNKSKHWELFHLQSRFREKIRTSYVIGSPLGPDIYILVPMTARMSFLTWSWLSPTPKAASKNLSI